MGKTVALIVLGVSAVLVARGAAATRSGGNPEVARVSSPAVVPSTAQRAPEPSVAEQPPATVVRVDPSEYAGLRVQLEDPSGRAMDAFYAALLRSARQESGAITRVSHYGDSSVAGDSITHTVRRDLQRRFGDAGHGFVLIGRGSMPYGHRDVRHRATGAWDLSAVFNASLRDGRYGYGGVAFRPAGRSEAWFATNPDGPVGENVSRMELYYQTQPGGGSVVVRVDDQQARSIDTRGEIADAFSAITVPDGPHSFSLRASGNARLYGVVLERDTPGVVYDSLGLVGARARRLLNFEASHIARQIAHRDVDLLVLGFGGNDADDSIGSIDQYAHEYGEVIDRMRAGRQSMSCLVFAPLDQGEIDEQGRAATMATVPRIVEAQRRAAQAKGCAFFDTFSAMGGEGAMARWATGRRGLARADLRHATPAGYQMIGELFYKALLKGFAAYLDAQ